MKGGICYGIDKNGAGTYISVKNIVMSIQRKKLIGGLNMTYPINEKEFVNICMKELGNHDEVDEKVAYTVAVTLNWAYYNGMNDIKHNS